MRTENRENWSKIGRKWGTQNGPLIGGTAETESGKWLEERRGKGESVDRKWTEVRRGGREWDEGVKLVSVSICACVWCVIQMHRKDWHCLFIWAVQRVFRCYRHFLISLFCACACRTGLCGFGPGAGEQRQQRGRRRQDLLLLQRASVGAGLWHRAHCGQSGPCLQGSPSVYNRDWSLSRFN